MHGAPLCYCIQMCAHVHHVCLSSHRSPTAAANSVPPTPVHSSRIPGGELGCYFCSDVVAPTDVSVHCIHEYSCTIDSTCTWVSSLCTGNWLVTSHRSLTGDFMTIFPDYVTTVIYKPYPYLTLDACTNTTPMLLLPVS